MNTPCHGKTELFFLERGESSKKAKAICRTCPFKDACLTKALKNKEGFGIWGEKSVMERRSIRMGRSA